MAFFRCYSEQWRFYSVLFREMAEYIFRFYSDSRQNITPPNINTICLPSSIENFDIENCKSTGWGRKTRNDLEFSRVLKKVYPLPIIPNDQCQKELRSTRLGKSYVVHDSFLCAGGKLKDTCDGDGGGLLF